MGVLGLHSSSNGGTRSELHNLDEGIASQLQANYGDTIALAIIRRARYANSASGRNTQPVKSIAADHKALFVIRRQGTKLRCAAKTDKGLFRAQRRKLLDLCGVEVYTEKLTPLHAAPVLLPCKCFYVPRVHCPSLASSSNFAVQRPDQPTPPLLPQMIGDERR